MDWRNVKYDAIVVGSGATGRMAAKCLTDGGASVLVLEAGPELSPDCRGEREKSQEEFEAIKSKQPIIIKETAIFLSTTWTTRTQPTLRRNSTGYDHDKPAAGP